MIETRNPKMTNQEDVTSSLQIKKVLPQIEETVKHTIVAIQKENE